MADLPAIRETTQIAPDTVRSEQAPSGTAALKQPTLQLTLSLRWLFIGATISLVVFGAFLVNETTLSFLRPDLSSSIAELMDLRSELAKNQQVVAKVKGSIASGSVNEAQAFYDFVASVKQLDDKSQKKAITENKTATSSAPSISPEFINDYISSTDNIEQISTSLASIQSLISGVRRDITNMFLIIRSFCLGALGGFAILMANYAFNDSGISLVSEDRFGRSLASMLMGGIVSILAFGLIYTKQISVFHIDEASSASPLPDFWRMTVLCILAGAFADRIFRTAVGRMDNIIGMIGTGAPVRTSNSSKAGNSAKRGTVKRGTK